MKDSYGIQTPLKGVLYGVGKDLGTWYRRARSDALRRVGLEGRPAPR